ncbi:MAG: ATP-binding protein, partial [Euryarchaeota archaeon]|nr:ATP-binding protein [Euryarchaeota archaeon]
TSVMKRQINVLLIEDNPVDARLIQELLSEASDLGFNFFNASTLARGLNLLASHDIDVILLDLGLPDSQGLNTVKVILQKAPHSPVVMLTILDDEELAIKAVREGAQDYLTKDALLKDEMTTIALTRSINYAIERKKIEEELRQMRDELEQRVADRTRALTELNQALRREIAGREKVEEKLRQYSTELEGHSERLEELVTERTAQLKDAERLATIGETAAMVGHDLRNPLQALQLLIDLQKQREKALSDQECFTQAHVKQSNDVYDKMYQQIFYMDKIVSDLYDYSRALTLTPTRVDLHEIVADTLSSIILPGEIHPTIEIPDSIAAYADEYALKRVLTNLVLNAVQAMPHGGTLRISAAKVNAGASISISDTGTGIPDEIKERIFVPLITHKAKGAGLGLAVSKRLMEAQGGTIDFQSEVGHGSTFTVTVPAKPVDETSDAEGLSAQ